MKRKERYEFICNAVELVLLIRKIYEQHPCGGALHIVLDDGNTEERFIEWCIANSIPEKNERDKKMYYRCAELLLSMSETDRQNCISAAFRLMARERFSNDPVMKDIKDGSGLKPIITDEKNGLLHIE